MDSLTRDNVDETTSRAASEIAALKRRNCNIEGANRADKTRVSRYRGMNRTGDPGSKKRKYALLILDLRYRAAALEQMTVA
jgi:hypothetical protein